MLQPPAARTTACSRTRTPVVDWCGVWMSNVSLCGRPVKSNPSQMHPSIRFIQSLSGSCIGSSPNCRALTPFVLAPPRPAHPSCVVWKWVNHSNGSHGATGSPLISLAPLHITHAPKRQADSEQAPSGSLTRTRIPRPLVVCIKHRPHTYPYPYPWRPHDGGGGSSGSGG